ncbi:MAG: hypothetical protein WCL70_02950 [Paludibacter sp.]
MRLKDYILVLILFVNGHPVFAESDKCQLWQWNTTLHLTDNEGRNYTVSPYLWVPPACKKLNAVMFSSTAILEQTTVEDPGIRAVCAKYGIAIVWSDTQFYHDETTGLKQIDDILAQFSEISGYDELKSVPWIPVGHSATLKMIRDMPKVKMNKLACMIMHKNNNGFGYSSEVPVLTTYGEFVEWDSYTVDLKTNGTKDKAYPAIMKAREANIPVSYFSDPNTGHFDCSKSLMKNISKWLDDICAIRFDSEGNLKTISLEKGWVCQLPVPGFTGFKPKPYSQASDSEKINAWYPTYETALAAYNMANVSMTRKPQIAGFADMQGNYETGWWRAIMYNIPYLLEINGTLKIKTIPYLKMPNGQYANKFTDNKNSPEYEKLYSFSNKNDDFENSGNPLETEAMSGNLNKIDNQTFEYIPRFNSASYLIVKQQGNENFRSSVQPGRLNFQSITHGKENLITFPPVPNQELKQIQAIKLNASSSSGLKVKYFVKFGAARIESTNRLIIEKENIPPKTKFPYEISVTAYQLGSQNDSVKTATSVSCTFNIYNTK